MTVPRHVVWVNSNGRGKTHAFPPRRIGADLPATGTPSLCGATRSTRYSRTNDRAKRCPACEAIVDGRIGAVS